MKNTHMMPLGDSHGYEGENSPTFIKYLMKLEIDNVHKFLIQIRGDINNMLKNLLPNECRESCLY